MKGSSCSNISISFFSLPGPEGVTLRPSGATTTWLFELSVTSLLPSIRKKNWLIRQRHMESVGQEFFQRAHL